MGLSFISKRESIHGYDNAKPASEARRIWFMSLVVLLLAVTARLMLLAFRGPEISPDSLDYLRLAHNMLAHGSFSLNLEPPFAPSIRWPPLYPAFIAALSWTGNPSIFVVATAQSVLDSMTAVMLLFMARTLLPLKWAFFVALVYALHPGMIPSSRAILTETLFAALLVSAIWALALSFRSDRMRMTALSGLILGLAILCRPIALFLPFILSSVIVLMRRSRRSIVQGLVLVGIALLVITPWSIRSSRVAGRFVAVQDSSVLASLFYVATRWDWDQKDSAQLWPRLAAETKRLIAAEVASDSTNSNGKLQQVRVSEILFREGLRNIRANPVKYLASRARSFPYLFVTSYDSLTGINQSLGEVAARRDVPRLAVKLLLLVIFSLLPFSLAIIGLIHSTRNVTAAVCAIVWLYVLVFFIPLWLEPRYWLPCVPFLLISAALGAHSLWHRFRRRAGEKRT